MIQINSEAQLKVVYLADGLLKNLRVNTEDVFTNGVLDRNKVMRMALGNEDLGVYILNPKLCDDIRN